MCNYKFILSALFALSVLFSGFPVLAQSPGVLEKIADGCQFTEGPVWRQGVGLYFSDINGNTVYLWRPDSGKRVYITNSSGANGLAFDQQGRLIMALQGGRKLVRRELNGTITTLAAAYGGKKLNSPNDIAVKSDGSIFFTDPPYGLNGVPSELGYCGIFRLSTNGTLSVLDKTLSKPNGIAFSPDESKLYVDDTELRKVYVFDVVNDSILANKRLFFTASGTGNVDGMKIDSAGNLWCAGPYGIWVISPSGIALDTILVPGSTTNCNWGGDDMKTLFITAGTAVYRYRPLPSIVKTNEPGYDHGVELFPNYPNPFNPDCNISYKLQHSGNITLHLFNAAGELVRDLYSGYSTSGKHTVIITSEGLNSGVYFCTLSVKGISITRKIILLK